MQTIKKILGNRYARLLLGVLLLVVLAAVALTIQRARRSRTRASAVVSRTREEEQAALTKISPAEAFEKRRRGEALLLDVRDAELFELSGGIEGAVNIPLAELNRRKGELPKGETIIVYAYTRVPAEVEAAEVAAGVLEGNCETAILKGRFADWQEAGFRFRLPKAMVDSPGVEQAARAVGR